MRPRKVLVVDDEPGIAAALMARLTAHGYETCHAANGLDGVEAARTYRPDAVLLDIRMPDIDGYEVCTRMRQVPELRDTPVIFLSANAQEWARQRAVEVGGSTFLSKPFEAADVIEAIEKYAARHANETEGSANA